MINILMDKPVPAEISKTAVMRPGSSITRLVVSCSSSEESKIGITKFCSGRFFVGYTRLWRGLQSSGHSFSALHRNVRRIQLLQAA